MGAGEDEVNDTEWIEQAVFTSAVTDRAAGYQVVAASPGIAEADLRELAVWGPSHDALLVSAPGAASINFHALPSGAYCVSRTTPSGWEYSGRGGARVYTQSLIVPPPVLARFGNNPFAMVRAALAGGLIRVYDEVPQQLAPFRLPGRASAVDAGVLARLAAHPGPEWMSALIQAALRSTTLAIAGGPPAESLIAGMINCLPPGCRPSFSFSSGLKFSSRRPFRIVALSDDAEEQRRVERLYDVTMLRVSGKVPCERVPVDPWPRLIRRVLKLGRTSLLASELSKRHHNVDLDDLSALGLQLLEELDASALEDAAEPLAGSGGLPAEALPAAVAPRPHPLPEITQAHMAHAQFRGTSETNASVTQADLPSGRLAAGSPAVRRRLEQVDQLVRTAVCGDIDGLEQLRLSWPKLREELGDALLARSKEAYLRYALAIWEEYLQSGQTRNPERALQTLDVLSVLFDEV